tara:strand:- start:11773 stop:12969 length:1197 start_codon:yes stop_codon:yes gene_type:complete
MEDPTACSYVTIVNEELPIVSVDVDTDETFSDTYEYNCIRTEYYFCPGISGPLMRVEIVKDICKTPPVVISISECKEFLECNPAIPIVEEEPCTTTSGYSGTKSIYCDKGFLKPGPCVGACPENDCDTSEEKNSSSSDDAQDENDNGSIEDINNPIDNCEDQEVDVLFLVDMSASMKNEIGEVINGINTFTLQYAESNTKWGMIVGPLNAGETPGNQNYLAIISNLQDIKDFSSDIQIVAGFDLNSQYEMLYDGLYLAIRNISTFLPYKDDTLLWPTWIGDVFAESVPPLEDFKINWRTHSKKVIIIFTNEIGQSFLFPKSKIGKSYNTKDTITKKKLETMILSIPNLKVYTFTDEDSKSGLYGWDLFSEITEGKWYMLYDGNLFSNLSSIIEESACL